MLTLIYNTNTLHIPWRWQSHIARSTVTQIPAKNIWNWTSPFGNCWQLHTDIRSHHSWHIPEPFAESSHRTFCNVKISWAGDFRLSNAHEKHHALFVHVLTLSIYQLPGGWVVHLEFHLSVGCLDVIVRSIHVLNHPIIHISSGNSGG